MMDAQSQMNVQFRTRPELAFTALPPDILQMVLGFLSLSDLGRVACTCKSLNTYAKLTTVRLTVLSNVRIPVPVSLVDKRMEEAVYIIVSRALVWGRGHGCDGEGSLYLLDLVLKRIDRPEVSSFTLAVVCWLGHLDAVILLLQDKDVDPSDFDHAAVVGASARGHVDILAILLMDTRIDLSNVRVLRVPSNKGYTEVVAMLLRHGQVDPSAYADEALRCASRSGHNSLVRLLLKDSRVNPSAAGNYAIRCACKLGSQKIVKLLLRHARMDCSIGLDMALQAAEECGHRKIASMLHRHFRRA
eukprot:CFRG2470T1